MLRFSQVSNKEVFDEVFVRHGRSLKPDLVVAQWNHLGDFSAISGDERCLLPDSLWGRDESYLWYSTGGSANLTDLRRGFLGDATLQCRFIRGAFRDKPYTLGKYEATRVRAAIAELAANGGAPMGFYTRFTDPEARREIARYYGFLRRHETIYRDNRPYAEAVLLFPREAIARGELAPLDEFRRLGRAFLDEHLLFDVLPDDALGRAPPGRPLLAPGAAAGPVPPENRSRFACPSTVRVSASRPAASDTEIDLHFVNYDRQEPPPTADGTPSPGSGISDEKPVPAGPIEVDLVLPPGREVDALQFLTPERPDPELLRWTASAGRLQFQTPGFLVYGVARLTLR
jgi:hypothetical protein